MLRPVAAPAVHLLLETLVSWKAQTVDIPAPQSRRRQRGAARIHREPHPFMYPAVTKHLLCGRCGAPEESCGPHHSLGPPACRVTPEAEQAGVSSEARTGKPCGE